MQTKYGFETTGERSKLMSKIKASSTQPEIKLRKALFSNGVRFRINNKLMFGKPDLVIKKYRLVIFIDGEFWHGFNWDIKRERIQCNRNYWIPKIERNMQRDKLVNIFYENKGWTIIRFWSKEIKVNLTDCVNKIISAIKL